ncbi:hypothetical protein B0H13DRAFT_2293217 [Mycena leptocephala]|nr:hypothetical protein B0H13DRAFT_2293217 [Mycena leptocephala]
MPTLTIDLEREVFEISALSRPKSIPTLMLVAWRVKTWVEPLLYRTIVVWRSARFAPTPAPIEGHPTFYRRTLIPIIKSKPTSFFRDSVRHLLIHQIPEDDTEGQSILNDLELWCGLALIPNLTHLAFNGLNFLPVWPTLLENCPLLQLLICFWDGDDGLIIVAADKDGDKVRRDPRFVLTRCEEFEKDWQLGAHTGADYWVRAEAFAAKRRSGEIAALDCELKETRV